MHANQKKTRERKRRINGYAARKCVSRAETKLYASAHKIHWVRERKREIKTKRERERFVRITTNSAMFAFVVPSYFIFHLKNVEGFMHHTRVQNLPFLAEHANFCVHFMHCFMCADLFWLSGSRKTIIIIMRIIVCKSIHPFAHRPKHT